MTRFFDSNILLYVVDNRAIKTEVAERLVFEGGTISVQVLNEFVDVARRKLKFSMPKILEALSLVAKDLKVVPLTQETHQLAMEIILASDIRTYDANIVAAAELAGCDVLYTEDLNHGQRFGRVEIRNPFK
jgi:predicted nucleic acid-binding protein